MKVVSIIVFTGPCPRYNVLPVTYNGVDMAAVAPPHSYINTLDYTTVSGLAR